MIRIGKYRLTVVTLAVATAAMGLTTDVEAPAQAQVRTVFGSAGGYASVAISGLPAGRKDCRLERATNPALDGPFGSSGSTDSPSMPLAFASTRGSAVTLRAQFNNPHVPFSARLPLPPGSHAVRVYCEKVLPDGEEVTVLARNGVIRV